ncbi:hypothetical protein PHMEG_00028431 [Phytophthora megakarya]|uniref:VHS domain-containing protein n=1 Tax=Phytophthora megakarya TaxID=4795 RepID=A0A225V600_9STRA|nr:hypothetical protein PHMEG_00028431 [Phytophthora megakarya]
MNQGILELNCVNEAARFDNALNGYFRLSTATGKRRGGRGSRHIPPQSAETNATETSPETFLTQLKRILRDAEAPVQSQYIRRAVELCREVFKRSVVYRALIATQVAPFFDQLLKAAGEDPRANVSRALRARNRGSMQLKTVLTLIETWKQDYGDKYPALVAGHAVLVEKGYEFPHERKRQEEEREREINTRQHRERVYNAKKLQRDREMARYVPEMEQVLVEMNRVFEILVPTLDSFHLEGDQAAVLPDENDDSAIDRKKRGEQHNDARDAAVGENDELDEDDMKWEDVDHPSPGVSADDEEEEDVEWESVAMEGDSTLDDNADEDAEDEMDINDIVQAYGLGSSSYQLTIEVSKQVCEESSENDALFRSLADSALRMQKRFLPLLDDWEQHSTLTNTSSSSSSTLQSQREVLQRIRDLHDRMTHALLKWEDLVQGSKKQKQDSSTRSAVVSLPLDAYNPPPAKRRRQSRLQSKVEVENIL